jgi:hypothetical protein
LDNKRKSDRTLIAIGLVQPILERFQKDNPRLGESVLVACNFLPDMYPSSQKSSKEAEIILSFWANQRIHCSLERANKSLEDPKAEE